MPPLESPRLGLLGTQLSPLDMANCHTGIATQERKSEPTGNPNLSLHHTRHYTTISTKWIREYSNWAAAPRTAVSRMFENGGSVETCTGGAVSDCSIRWRSANPATLVSKIAATNSPHGVRVGAGAATLVHVPACPGQVALRQRVGAGRDRSRLSTQKPVEHLRTAWRTRDPAGLRVGERVSIAVRKPDAVKPARPVR